MRPKLELLTPDVMAQVFDEAFQLLMKPGIKVQSVEARELLADAGADVDNESQVVRIPERIVRKALESTPHEFWLHDRHGNPKVHYGGDAVHFDPGSSAINVLDPDTGEHRPAVTADLARLVKVAEMLPQFDAQSTAVVCNEVPEKLGDIYRLYVVLMLSEKPIVTGSFALKNLEAMFDLLAIHTGGRAELAQKPQAIFDVCPSPPLIWSSFGAGNLIQLARAGVPAEIISMPLAGAGGPVTILGSLVQHTAECLSGITIHQLAKPGSPVVWGGAPAIFDMRKGGTPMGAIETAMLDAGYAQIGKSLGMPTHGYLCATDAKLIDAQSGMESGMTALIGGLAGINMISGAGMLDFLACHSAEKLVIDAEAVGMIKHMVQGVQVRTDPLATNMYDTINFKADFLKLRVTRDLFQKEQYLPSNIIDRDSMRAWQLGGSLNTFDRAKKRTDDLVAKYQRPQGAIDRQHEMTEFMLALGREYDLEKLPIIPGAELMTV